MFLLAKYGVQTSFRFAVIKSASSDLAASGDWTPATGDTKISKDGGNVANTSNNPSAVGGTGSVLWSITLTAAELQAGEVVIQIVDSATKAIEDQTLVIYTYGHASAKIQADLSDSVWLGLTGGSTIKAKTDLIPASPAQEGTLSTIDGKVDSVLADTNMLQVDWVNGGRLDLLIDGIKAKTDLIPASPAAVGSKMDIVDAPSSAGKTALANAAADQVWDEVASGHVASGSTGALLGLVHSILGGKQQIIDNQLICYAADNATEVARFNLFDSDGDPTMVAVYLRTRV
jgi:uncharacterized protein YdeI (BOF family)